VKDTLRQRYINTGNLKTLCDVPPMSVRSHNIASCRKLQCTGLGCSHTSGFQKSLLSYPKKGIEIYNSSFFKRACI